MPLELLSPSEVTAMAATLPAVAVVVACRVWPPGKLLWPLEPLLELWLLGSWFFLGGIGLYNLFKYDIRVLRAFNPKYIVDYFKRNDKQGWLSLGGMFLCITGSEAMFADLGHFNVRAIQISFTLITCPAILCAYTGQAAFLRKFPEKVGNTFYESLPNPIYWPTFVVAIGAAIIASQAMILGAFPSYHRP
ncbi:Potassium transporter [Arachis hypogaea]|nr:Potassium transporter [Arachis hypogaea]